MDVRHADSGPNVQLAFVMTPDLTAAIEGDTPAVDVATDHAAFRATLAARDIRLSLDGDTLRVTGPKGALTDELKAALASRKEGLLELLRGNAQITSALPHGRVPRTPALRLSFAQQEMWFLNQLHPESSAYNIAASYRVSGPLDVAVFVRVLEKLPARHEALWLRFRDADGTPVADVSAPVAGEVQVLDLTSRAPALRETEAWTQLAGFARAPFNLEQGPLLRALLIRLAPDEQLFQLCVHHIAADGWSMSVLLSEISERYAAAVSGRPAQLSELALEHVDYAAWEHEQERAGLFEQDLDYWRTELQGAPSCIHLPLDRARPDLRSYRSARLVYSVDAATLEALRAFANANEATLFVFMLACWQILLHRLSGDRDVLVGTPVANRDDPRFEQVVGCFVNTMVFRGRLDGNPTFAAYLAQTRETVTEGFQHRLVPFDLVSRALRPDRSAAFSRLFQVMLVLHSFPAASLRAAEVTFEPTELRDDARSSTGHDLKLELEEDAGGLRFTYEYATDLFDEVTIARLHSHYVQVLRQVMRDTAQRIEEIPLLTEAEERTLLDEVNDTAAPLSGNTTVHELVSSQARLHPEHTAIHATDATLTYAELERQSNRLAQRLRSHGVSDGALVGICLDRSAVLPMALLAVWKAGAAYVPVDPAHPAARVAYTLTDAGVACVITDPQLAHVVDGVAPLVIIDGAAADEDGESMPAPDTAVGRDALAYVMYTSGSTGRPKGVEVTHGNVLNFLRSMAAEPGFRQDDTLLAVTTPSFDIAGLELFLPLSCGGTTVIVPREDTIDGARLAQYLVQHRVTMMQATPATWRLMIATGWQGKADLRVLCGGEAFPRELARALMPMVGELWNMYGPTETTIWSTIHRVTDASREIAIGHPIANTSVFVVDAHGKPVPQGVSGELWIAGLGVARGYRGRPELTAEKFVALSLPGGRGTVRAYRTGDIVRFRNDRRLEFVGRRDHQVKLRGYRIELGEIEAVLAEQDVVGQAVVIVREDSPGDQRLVAYVVPGSGERLDVAAIRRALRVRLPHYMVPNLFVELTELPLTPNGKIDRKALPAPMLYSTAPAPVEPGAGSALRVDAASAASASQTALPSAHEQHVSSVASAGTGVSVSPGTVEAVLATIWCELLAVSSVNRDDDFFDRGGHSLLATRVLARIQAAFGVRLPLRALFDAPTLAQMAALISVGPAAPRREFDL